MAYLLNIKHVKITPYNSKGNRKVEYVPHTIKIMMRPFIDNYPENWDLLLSLLEFAFNTSESEVTKVTSFLIHYGRHPNYPLDMVYDTEYKPVTTTNSMCRKCNSREAVYASG